MGNKILLLEDDISLVDGLKYSEAFPKVINNG